MSLNIKELRAALGYSQQRLSDETGISKAKIEKWEVGKGSPKVDDTDILKKYFFKMGVLNDDDTYLKQRFNQKLQPKRKEIPLFDAPTEGGQIFETEMTAISAPSGTIDVGDLLSDSEAALRVYGNSMIPNYPPGCVVGLIKYNEQFIEPGEVYVLETRKFRRIKRLFYKDDNPDSDTIVCYSDNIMKFENGGRHGLPAYPPFHVKKEEIINIYLVSGVIKRNANSIIINR